jgi:hypothetical protein
MRGAVTERVTDRYAIRMKAVRAESRELTDDAIAQVMNEIHGAFHVPLADAPAN